MRILSARPQKNFETETWRTTIGFLKSFDKNGVAVVKLHSLECRKDCGRSNGKHSKDAVSNLFNNLKNSHIVTKGYIRQYCRKKGTLNEPQ